MIYIQILEEGVLGMGFVLAVKKKASQGNAVLSKVLNDAKKFVVEITENLRNLCLCLVKVL